MIRVEIVGTGRRKSIKIVFDEELGTIRKKIEKNAFNLSKDLSNLLIERFFTGGTTATRLAVRTGNLRRSTLPLGKKIKEDNREEYKIVIGARVGVKYASTHIGTGETIIRPRRAKYLAIPLPAAQTPAGVSRYASPRDIEGDTFIAKNVIFKKVGDSITPMFALKKEVRVPKRVDPDIVFDLYSKRLKKRLEALFNE